MTVAINARAAARREIGGVERLAREMATRLPRLPPDRYRVIQPPAALPHRARLVITVSQFSKREIVDVLGADPERITVVPGGVDERFRPDAHAALGMTRPYVLVVGTRITRKNTSALAQAAQRLNALGVELAHAGSGRGYMRPEANANLRGLGYVPDEQMPGLYAGALALAMPSLYEGL